MIIEDAPLPCITDRWLLFGLGLVIALCCGCAEGEPTFLLDPPDGEAEGEHYGVAAVERDFRVRLDDTVSTVLYLPTDDVDSVADGPFPVVVLLHGGLVESHQYAWLARHFAQRGFIVAAPEHAFDLAIFSSGNARDITAAIDRANERNGDFLQGRISNKPAIATGHSLGGVIATKTWLDAPERFSHLLLLQSVPDENDAEQLAQSRPDDHRVFAIAGGRDGRIGPDDIHGDLSWFSVDVPLAVIEGQNHFQLVDGPEPSRFEDDNPASISQTEGRDRLLNTVDVFIDSYRDDAVDFADTDLWPDGVTAYEEWTKNQ